jgi:hypothetical protein
MPTGHDVSRLSPSDAIAALRSFPRRFRAAMAVVDEETEEALHRPGPDGLSAHDHVDGAGRELGRLAAAIDRVLDQDRPVLDADLLDEDRGRPLASTTTPSMAVDSVSREAEALADRVAHVDAESWGRVGIVPGRGEIAALDLLREAARRTAVHLAAAERARS